MVIDVTLVVSLLLLVALLFILAMVEASLLHVRRSAVVAAAAEGDPRTQRLLDLVDDLPVVMNSVLLAVLLGQVTATSIAGVLARRWSEGGGVTLAAIGVTVVLFLYGEALPKTFAIRRPLHHARRLVPVVWVCHHVLGPFVAVLVWLADRQTPGSDGVDTVSAVSEGELLHLAVEAAEAGEIDVSDAELIERSFTVGDLRAAEILIPLPKVITVDRSTPVGVALSSAIDAGHRRLPVIEPTTKDVLGFVRLRDLAEATRADPDQPVEGHVRPVLTVDTAAPVIEVLRQMQATGRHLAVVVDQRGATAGIMTIEDIVEELVGAIDEPEP